MLDEPDAAPLGDLLAAAAAAWHHALMERLAALELAFAGGAAGDLLRLVPPAGIPQTLLTRRAGLSKQAVQQLLDRLEAEGAVERRADPADRRARYVLPTTAGLAAATTRRQLEATLEAELRDALGGKRHARLRKGLRRLVSSGAARPPGP